MISVTKTGKAATVVVSYNFTELYHQAVIAYKSQKTSKSEKGPMLLTFHSTIPGKLLDAIKTETGDVALAVNVMRLYMQQMVLRCRELTMEVKTLSAPIKVLSEGLKKVKGVVEAE